MVDDNPMIRRAFARMFRGLGHEPEVVGSVAEVIDRLHASGITAAPIDAVLTDYDLGPGGTGRVVCQVARAHGLPVVMMTGNANVMSSDVGAEVVEKPAEISQLLEALRRAGALC
jgi:CheY-like chemotaxis protein